MDYYEILGVEPTAPQEEIEKRYRAIAKKLHPDQHPPEKRAEYERKMKELNEAFSALKDPDKRKSYQWENSSTGDGRSSPGYGPAAGYPFTGKVIITTFSGNSCLLSLVLLLLSLAIFRFWGVLIWLVMNYLLFTRRSRIHG